MPEILNSKKTSAMTDSKLENRCQITEFKTRKIDVKY